MCFLLEACSALNFEVQNPTEVDSPLSVSIDSRTIQPGDLFVALVTSAGNGHAYLQSAYDKGACGAVLHQSEWHKNKSHWDQYANLIIVEDSLEALRSLGLWFRNRFRAKNISITGSVGKTTTKELLASLLDRKFKVLKNVGNLNNHLGVPMTLMKITEDVDWVITELGANHRHDIEELCHLSLPDFAILTKVAPAHLEGFGSMEAIYQAKLDILRGLGEDGKAVIPQDEEILKRLPIPRERVVTVGEGDDADFQITQIRVVEGAIHFELNGEAYEIEGNSIANVSNAAMAIVMCQLIGMKVNDIAKFLQGAVEPKGRFEVLRWPNDILAVDDSYNANPESFRAALDSFDKMASNRSPRILVYGDMLELGSDSKRYHEELAHWIADSSVEVAIGTGSVARTAHDELVKQKQSNVYFFENRDELCASLREYLVPNALLLFKASRSIGLERVIEDIQPTKAYVS